MNKRSDERNIMFSRLRLKEHTKRFDDFYTMHPELKESDQLLRENARARSNYPDGGVMSFLAPKAPFEEVLFNEITLPNREKAIKANEKYLQKKVNVEKTTMDIYKLTEQVKKKATEFGASLVGITKVEKDDFYSRKGITEFHDYYNEEVDDSYQYAIVIAQELKKEYMGKAPRYEQMVATEVGYDDGAYTTARLASYIKSLGYEAVTNNYFNYIAPMVPITLKAGIGELGKSYMVVTKTLGSRIKTAAVFTNMKLLVDQAVDFGLKKTCENCNLCVQMCPTQALSYDEIKLDDSKCMEMWQRARTDCGICIAVCPFSKCK